MNARVAFLDVGIGETRAVVTLDGRPERLLIRRGSEPEALHLGARSVARVVRAERGLSTLFLALADGGEAVAPAGGSPPAEGSAVEIEITAEPRRDKSAAARILGAAEGQPRLIAAGPLPQTWLATWAPGVEPVTSDEAREWADEAQESALAVTHPLPGGGSLAVETTRALTAIDVDLGGRPGGDARRLARQANLAAIKEGARLLRLKGLGGLVVFDLAGKGQDGPAMAAVARAAFEADMPGVSLGPVSRFGLFELALPWRFTPAAHILEGPPGQVSALSCAHSLVRAIEREARANPGGRLTATCAAEVALAAEPLAAMLAGRIGARFTIGASHAGDRAAFTVEAG
jgi:hypothetical protein